MLKIIGNIVSLLAAVFTFQNNGLAQSGLFIPKSAKIFFLGDSSTIFSNVNNLGQFGLGKNAVVNFKGTYWQNDPSSLVTDESNYGNGTTGQGGLLRFLIPDETLTGTISQQQFLTGGYNAATRQGPMFANVQINNPWGLVLDMSATKIRHSLDFKSGNVLTNNNTLNIGDNYPGKITGYNEHRFVVTGNTASTGVLLREKIRRADGHVAFPVGSTANGYAPVSVYLNSQLADDFYVRVSDSVFEKAVAGINMNDKSVNKTWQIGKILRPGKDDVELSLQHQIADEGELFQKHRQFSYISQYSLNAWDTAVAKRTPISPGGITSGIPVTNAAMNSRIFSGAVGTQSFYSKFSYPFADSAKSRIWVNGFRLNSELVKLVWTTRPEINIKYFIVQRKLGNQPAWVNIDSVDSKTMNGYSFSFTNYSVNDPNKSPGISYYRIIMVDYQNTYTYSDIMVIDGQSAPSRIAIWPNPSTGRFVVSMDLLQKVKTIVIWNALGQKVQETDVMDKDLVEMYLFTPGNYIIGFIANNRLIHSRKLVITGW